MNDVQPIAVLTRRDTADDRRDAAQILKRAGCLFVRFESRPGDVVTALGFASEAPNVMPL